MTTATSTKTLAGTMPLATISRCSSDCIVEFLITLFKIPRSQFTDAIHVSLQNLDRLAKNIDQKIDSGTKVPTLANLQAKIAECLSPLAGFATIGTLSEKTMKCASESLLYNSTERSLVYSFDRALVNHRTTLWYLYPLYKSLLEEEKRDTLLAKDLFILVTNYIQFLDDVCDLIDDLEQHVTTPATIYYQSLEQNFSKFMETSARRSNDFLTAIKLVAESLRVEPVMFSEWEVQARLIQLGQIAREFPKHRRTLLKGFQKSLPQILCYDEG